MRLSLSVKWRVALLVVGVVPLIVAGVATLRIQRRGLERTERELELAVCDEASSSITSTLEEAEATTRRAGAALYDARLGEIDTRMLLAREAVARSAALDAVGVFDETGKWVDTIAKSTATPSGLEALSLGPSEGDGATWRVSPAADGALDVYVIVRLGKDGAVAGHLVRETLTRLVSDLSRIRFGAPDRVLLVDHERRVLATDPASGFRQKEPLDGKDVFGAVSLVGQSFNTPFAATTEFTSTSGVPMVGTVRSLPARSWALVVRRPQAEAFGALAEARVALGASLALLVLLAAAGGAWVAGRATRPIARLVDLARAYGRRELDKKSELETGDELEELGDAMTEMASEIASSEDEVRRRAAAQALLERYLPREVAAAAAGEESPAALEGRRVEVTVLFADVAAFTPFAERASPEEVVTFLNQLFTILTEIVFRHGGMVDKFVGDCIMAVFGTSNEPDHAVRALAAADAMHRFVEAVNPTWQRELGVDAHLGIGVCSGTVLLGNVGGRERIEFTAVGDVVNVAARLETLARPDQTLISDATRALAGDAFTFHAMGDHALRGKRDLVPVFEVIE